MSQRVVGVLSESTCYVTFPQSLWWQAFSASTGIEIEVCDVVENPLQPGAVNEIQACRRSGWFSSQDLGYIVGVMLSRPISAGGRAQPRTGHGPRAGAGPAGLRATIPARSYRGCREERVTPSEIATGLSDRENVFTRRELPIPPRGRPANSSPLEGLNSRCSPSSLILAVSRRNALVSNRAVSGLRRSKSYVSTRSAPVAYGLELHHTRCRLCN